MPSQTYSNTNNYSIPDNTTTAYTCSPVTSTTTGSAGTVDVTVRIIHTWIGDLQVKLVSPSGTNFGLYNYPTRSDTGNSSDNVITTYTINAGSTAANGTWQLCVRDMADLDTGYIDSWSITF